MVEAWPPRTLDALLAAIDGGLLEEGHRLDIKRELAPGPHANQDVADDLAAFAVDGGLIFIGVDEDTTPPSITPVPLAGLAERIEQIGLQSVTPPVHVSFVPIPTGEDGEGILIVVDPPSPRAPHMVKDRYRGRGEKTNRVLPDPEVRRILRERAERLADVGSMLGSYKENLIGRRTRSGAGLFVVAHPSVGSRTMILDSIPNPMQWILERLMPDALTWPLTPRFAPDFLSGEQPAKVANGWVITHHSADELDIELLEDGSLRLYCGDLQVDPATVSDNVVAGLVRRVVLAAGVISADCDYFGGWDLALEVVGLRGRHAESARRTLVKPMPPYSEDGYAERVAVTQQELKADPSAIVERLLGRLARSFGGPKAIYPQ